MPGAAALLLSLPLLLRVRLGRFAPPPPPGALADRCALAAGLALLLPPLELDALLLERLQSGPPGGPIPAGPSPPLAFGLLGVLEVAPDTAVPEALADAVIGPAARLGSERAVVLELLARASASGDALRFLQMSALHEAGEVLASRPVARALEAAGGVVVGGPGPPLLAVDGALLTRI